MKVGDRLKTHDFFGVTLNVITRITKEYVYFKSLKGNTKEIYVPINEIEKEGDLLVYKSEFVKRIQSKLKES